MATTDPNPYRQRGLRTVINAKDRRRGCRAASCVPR